MIDNLLDLNLDCHVTGILQLVAERVFLKRNAKFSLVDGNVSDEVLVGEVAVHTQKSVERLKEQNMVARQFIVLDELVVDHSSHTPALEPLDVAQPNRLRHRRLGQVVVENLEEMAKFNRDVLQVVCTRCGVVLLEADNGTNHLVINRRGLEKIINGSREIPKKGRVISRLPDHRTSGRRPLRMIESILTCQN